MLSILKPNGCVPSRVLWPRYHVWPQGGYARDFEPLGSLVDQIVRGPSAASSTMGLNIDSHAGSRSRIIRLRAVGAKVNVRALFEGDISALPWLIVD